MSEVNYDNISIEPINITSNFKNKLISSDTLYMFWVSRSTNGNFDNTRSHWYFHGSDNSGKTTELFKIKTDRITKNKYIVEFSGSGIEGLDQSKLILDRYRWWRFYYSVNNRSIGNVYKAFDINLNDYCYNYTRNIIILDFSSIDPVFDFRPVYRYEYEPGSTLTGVPVPLYQHYHKTAMSRQESSPNVSDGTVIKTRMKEYMNNNKSYVDYGLDNSMSNSISANKVKINSSLNRFIIKPGEETDLKYTTSHGTFDPNSNLFNAFDNTEYSSIGKSDPYPLITIYGTDSVGELDEFDQDSCLLIYEIES